MVCVRRVKPLSGWNSQNLAESAALRLRPILALVLTMMKVVREGLQGFARTLISVILRVALKNGEEGVETGA